MIINANADNIPSACIELLWANNSINSGFSKQTVELNLHRYEILCIQFAVSSEKQIICTEMIHTDTPVDEVFTASYEHNTGSYYRNFSLSNDGVLFEYSTHASFSTVVQAVPTPTSALYMIPCRIYGIR